MVLLAHQVSRQKRSIDLLTIYGNAGILNSYSYQVKRVVEVLGIIHGIAEENIDQLSRCGILRDHDTLVLPLPKSINNNNPQLFQDSRIY